MEQVSWDDVQKFIHKLNARGGGRYRLPTEAEWEYACRSGEKDEKYCGSSDVDRVAWHDVNSGRKTHRVATKAANRLGIYDMSGNVSEWVEDWYCEKFYETKEAGMRNPACNDNTSGSRVLRGGSWLLNPWYLRAVYRSRVWPDDRGSSIGFRVVHAVSPQN